jgi:hypothetical protein
LGYMFKKQWSTYSDLIRKGFHHEDLSQSRINENQYLEINNPKISIVLSGTPNQIFNLIPDAEDGLFSRFIFYLFKSELKWESQRPDQSGFNLKEFFDSQSQEVLEMIRFFELQPAIFQLSIDQWDEKDEIFSMYLDRIVRLTNEDSVSVLNRMGLIFFRICMILTAIRYFDNRFPSPVMDCNQNDFNTAKIITQVYLEHSFLMFENLPKSSKHSITKFPSNLEMLFSSLPQTFRRQDAVNNAAEFGLSVKTVDNFLRDEKGRSLYSPKSGIYEKVQTENLKITG